MIEGAEIVYPREYGWARMKGWYRRAFVCSAHRWGPGGWDEPRCVRCHPCLNGCGAVLEIPAEYLLNERVVT